MAGKPELIGGMNRRLILGHLQKSGPCTRGELSRALGLSFPAVSGNLDTLRERGLVTATPAQGGRNGGRRPAVYAYNAGWGIIAAIDLGRHRIRFLICDALGKQLAADSFVPPEDAGSVPALIEEHFLSLLNSAGIPLNKVKLVSFGIPGVMDPASGRQQFAPYQHPTMREHRMDLYFQKTFGVKTCIQNSVNLAAIAEKWQGAGVNRRNIVYVDVAVGLGSALILDGKLYEGHTGAAGEIAYMLPGIEYRRAAFAEEGVLERFLSAYELQHRLAAGGGSATVESLLDSAEETLKPLLEELKAYFAMTLVNLAAMANPEVIICGGGIGKAVAVRYAAYLEAELKAHVPYPPLLLPAKLDGKAGALGAAAYALRLLHEDPLYYL